MALPLVSIITPVYNTKKYLNQAIESVKIQTLVDWEMILVDDCSDDGSWELLEDLSENDSRIKIFRNSDNSGSGISRNRAIGIAVGKYIAFLDSDDLWHPDKLKVQISLMEKKKWVFSHTSYGYISAEGEKIKSTFHVSNHPVRYRDLLKRTEISCLTAIYNQEVIGKYFMSEHRKKQDYALWLAILKSGIQSYPIDIELAYYRKTPNSATSKKWKLIINHVNFLMETQQMNLVQSLYYTFYWMINGFIRYFIK